MIQAEHLSYATAERQLYKNASFSIRDGEHCVLIGSNGCGKSTLIDLLLHRDDYICAGKVTKENVSRIAFVNQFLVREKNRALTVTEYLSEEFEEMQQRMDTLCEQMGEDEEAMERYQALLDEFMAMDGYNYEVNIQKELRIAGLTQIAQVQLSAVSGGEYKLVQIIRQMLRLPDMLIMDEPDVFLDFENLYSLRELINAYEGTLLAVTHNRYLLNHCFDKILLIENAEISEYEGSYPDFCFEQLAEKIAVQEMSMKESEFIALQEEVVERLREEASLVDSLKKGKALHARVSYLEHWKQRHIREPYLEMRRPSIRLPELPEERVEEDVLSVADYTVAFDRVILEKVSFTVKAGEKVALVGANGTGKTTLLRAVWEGKDPHIRVGEGVTVDFLSQFHGETLREDATVWELMDALGFVNESQAAEYLADYCFPPEALSRKISTLSGGEKNLLQLARMSCGRAELLLLDEPSSHLDLRAQLALEEAIRAYRGSVLMVSHDFTTIANCMDYVLFAENGTIRRMSARAFRKMIYKRYFPQNYLELEQKKKELEQQINAALALSEIEKAKLLCEKLADVVGAMQGRS